MKDGTITHVADLPSHIQDQMPRWTRPDAEVSVAYPRPGVCSIAANLRGVNKTFHIYYCGVCLKPYPGGFVLLDEIWKVAAPENGILCLDCTDHAVREKLGRGLTVGDFKDITLNEPIFWALKHLSSPPPSSGCAQPAVPA